MITIRYNHTSEEQADCLSIARNRVRSEMRYCAGSKHGADEMVEVKTDDGIYCYQTQADADADQTGASAFAVIEV